MEAIETVYKGYRFRSRLEARWAVFFDALGIEWEYEPEGYEFTDGTRYLPDFWLPQIRYWGEVKPKELTAQERHKVEMLASESKIPVLLLVGLPDFKDYFAVYGKRKRHGIKEFIEYQQDYKLYLEQNWDLPSFQYWLNERYYCDFPAAFSTDYIHYENRLFYSSGFDGYPECYDDLCRSISGRGAYTKAVKSARSARFEFGESGAGVR